MSETPIRLSLEDIAELSNTGTISHEKLIKLYGIILPQLADTMRELDHIKKHPCFEVLVEKCKENELLRSMDDLEARNKAIDAYYGARSNLSGREYVNIVIDAYLGYMEALKSNKHTVMEDASTRKDEGARNQLPLAI